MSPSWQKANESARLALPLNGTANGENAMTMHKKRDQTADDRHDTTVEDSFPASDPPANSGIVGPRGEHAHGERRTPSHRRDDADRPKGTPTDERHAAETAHAWEDEHHQPHRR
jgi:hypothetical protein